VGAAALAPLHPIGPTMLPRQRLTCRQSRPPGPAGSKACIGVQRGTRSVWDPIFFGKAHCNANLPSLCSGLSGL
jgi:hypothetical protein